jgi:recombinational DNA repair ATPase RecF
MFLKSVKLTNFRCFDKLELSFSDEGDQIRKRTLLLGENGTGKTNLLKAIALVTAGSNALGELIGNPDDWIQYNKDYC